MSSDCSADHTCFGHVEILKYITNVMMNIFIEHAFVPLGWRQNREKVGGTN